MAKSDVGKSPFSGFVLDPGKCGELSLKEKRELVHEVAKWHKDAPRILSSFSRRELLEIICAEMGKERKYTGYTKHQMIEHLLKLITQKFEGKDCDENPSGSPEKFLTGVKRQRIKEKTPLQPQADQTDSPVDNVREHAKFRVCQNLACKAKLSMEDTFCKRCSCCICHCYDDNKDPSLWLACGSDSPNEDDSCGMSCHLQCAFKLERAGITSHSSAKLDGSYYCVSCGRVNGLMRTWRKQLLVAKEARRVDMLCLRIYLARRILMGTEKHIEVHKKVDCAADLLKSEVGPLDQVSRKMARGIVNRLSCGFEVQNLCASALEGFDSMFCDPQPDNTQKDVAAECSIKIEESLPNSVSIGLEYDDHLLKDIVGCRLWHRKSVEDDYPEKPTIFVLRPEKKFKIIDLNSSTEYICKITFSGCSGTLGTVTATWSTPAYDRNTVSCENVKEEIRLVTEMDSQMESTNSSEAKVCSRGRPEKLKSSKDIHKRKHTGVNSHPASPMFPVSVSPATPCKLTETREVTDTGCGRQLDESDYEYSVRVVKWLELHGFIDEYFRVKFLTWFSLRATARERRVVSVFVDTLIDDPSCLAGQIEHTFKDMIHTRKIV